MILDSLVRNERIVNVRVIAPPFDEANISGQFEDLFHRRVSSLLILPMDAGSLLSVRHVILRRSMKLVRKIINHGLRIIVNKQ